MLNVSAQFRMRAVITSVLRSTDRTVSTVSQFPVSRIVRHFIYFDLYNLTATFRYCAFYFGRPSLAVVRVDNSELLNEWCARLSQ